MSFVVLCDFDGTVLTIDTCEFVLDRFAKEDWRIFDRQLEKGEITLEECLRIQFETVRVPKKLILREIDKVASLRPNFDRLVEYVNKHKCGLILVSAGMDFVIRHILKRKGLLESVDIYSPKAKVTVNGIKFDFPTLFDKSSDNFKEDLVKHCKRRDKKVIYIGDGMTDYEAAKSADFAFAIKSSKLAQLLRRSCIRHEEIDDFREVVEFIKTTF